MIRTARSREVGLSVELMIQVGIMFVMSPLAATGEAPVLWVEILRIGLAAAAVILLTRSHVASLAIVATFAVSLLLLMEVRTGMGATAVQAGRLPATAAFDLAVAAAVANVAFGKGGVTVHRITAAVILLLLLRPWRKLPARRIWRQISCHPGGPEGLPE